MHVNLLDHLRHAGLAQSGSKVVATEPSFY
jgi:hypothetical protein